MPYIPAHPISAQDAEQFLRFDSYNCIISLLYGITSTLRVEPYPLPWITFSYCYLKKNQSIQLHCTCTYNKQILKYLPIEKFCCWPEIFEKTGLKSLTSIFLNKSNLVFLMQSLQWGRAIQSNLPLNSPLPWSEHPCACALYNLMFSDCTHLSKRSISYILTAEWVVLKLQMTGKEGWISLIELVPVSLVNIKTGKISWYTQVP